MRHKGIFILFACLFFFATSSCQAEERKDEWKNPNFNFRSIRTILVNTSHEPQAKLDEFNVRKVEALYSNVFFQNGSRGGKNNFLFITPNQLKDRVSKALGEDIRKIEVEDPVRYKEEMERFTSIIVDAVLNIKVTAFGYDQRFVEESVYTYTEQVETEVDMDWQNSAGQWVHGKRKIRQPVERTRVTPAHYDTYGNAGMDYILLDVKSKESIWMLRDVREAHDKDPISMTERIMNRALDNLLKI